MLDLLVRSGSVVDGTGGPARRADVGVRDGRIVAVGNVDHPTSLSPGPFSAAENPKDHIESAFANVPEDITRKVLHDNAARLYHLD